MALQHVTFRCGACGFGFEADIGTKEGGSFRRAFWCPKEKGVVVHDVLAASFRGRCPKDDGQLELLADFPLDHCPTCEEPTGVEKSPYFGTTVSREGGTGRR